VASGALWYFAYGSNMHPSIFNERRGMHPIDARPGRLDGHRLCFNLPVGPGERGVANLLPEPGAHTWGVLYLLPAAELDHLDRTELVHRGLYQRLPVEVVARRHRVPAFTYQSLLGSDGRKPSKRYRRLLIEGARHHGLPAEYIAMLEGLELAFDERVPPEE